MLLPLQSCLKPDLKLAFPQTPRPKLFMGRKSSIIFIMFVLPLLGIQDTVICWLSSTSFSTAFPDSGSSSQSLNVGMFQGAILGLLFSIYS